MRGTGTLPDAFLAMLLCTCDRWGRVTAKLIAAIDGSGILTGADLDELGRIVLSEEVVIEYPFLWACPQGLDLGSSDEGAPGFVVDENTMAKTRRRPSRPFAAGQPPGRFDTTRGGSTTYWHPPARWRPATARLRSRTCSTPRMRWKRTNAAGWCGAGCVAA